MGIIIRTILATAGWIVYASQPEATYLGAAIFITAAVLYEWSGGEG